MKLNQHTIDLCGRMVAAAPRLRIGVGHCPAGSRIIDCGINASGGLEVGRRLAEVCMAGLGDVSFTTVPGLPWAAPAVAVRTDFPVLACLASQHPGWPVAVKRYSALGCGPMRAAAGKDSLFETIGHQDAEPMVVGSLESAQLPNSEVCEYLARECGVTPPALTLLVAPAASLAGTIRAVACTVDVAMCKLLSLGFDVYRVESGFGTAPLPPVGADDAVATGRTRGAIVFGGEVTLWVRGDDESLAEIGPKLPGQAASDQIGPAIVNLVNLDTGRSFRFGRVAPELLEGAFKVEKG